MDNAMRNVIEAAREYGFFVHRPDVNNWDFTIADFPLAGTFYDLDLTSIVPEHTHAVLLRTLMRTGHIGYGCIIRRKGYVSNYVASHLINQVANVGVHNDVVVGVGPDRIIQGYRHRSVITAFSIIVKGWWF